MESEKKDVAMWVMELEAKVQALEAERDRLKSEMQYAILYIEAADHKAAYDVLTQALKGGDDGHEAL